MAVGFSFAGPHTGISWGGTHLPVRPSHAVVHGSLDPGGQQYPSGDSPWPSPHGIAGQVAGNVLFAF